MSRRRLQVKTLFRRIPDLLRPWPTCIAKRLKAVEVRRGVSCDKNRRSARKNTSGRKPLCPTPNVHVRITRRRRRRCWWRTWLSA
eukprot:6183900-Pleurochrysis_carterae.AAC.4